MSIHRLIRSPWTTTLLASLAAGVSAHGLGERDPALLTISVAAGASLGAFLHLSISSLAILFGRERLADAGGAGALARLERDKRVVLRSIKDIEFDIELARISKEEGDPLIRPLRDRAMRLLREIDRAKASGAAMDRNVDSEIDAAIAARVDELHDEQASARADSSMDAEPDEVDGSKPEVVTT